MLEGTTLLDHAIEAAAALASDVIVVAAHDAPASAPKARIVRDELSDEGPLAGALTGLRAAATDWVALLAGDAPRVSPALLRAMAAEAERRDAAVALAHDGRLWPMPSVLPRARALEAAARLIASGERRLRALPDALGAIGLDRGFWAALDPDANWAHDVDVPDDLV